MLRPFLIFLSGLFLTTCQTLPPAQWQWQRAEAGLPRQALVLTVAADPTNPENIWAGTYAADSLLTSRDGGLSWSIGSIGPGDNPIFDLLATGDMVYAATRRGLWQSNDSGASWQLVEGLPVETAFALDGATRLLVGLDNAGVYAQVNDGQGWVSLNQNGLETAAVLSLVVSAEGRQIYGGTSGRGVFASRDGGQSWLSTYPGEYVANVALNPLDPTVAVASLHDRLVRTVDGGQSWHTLPPDWPQEQVTSLLWLDDGTLGAGTSQGRLFFSRDNGDTWQEGGSGLPDGGVLSLAKWGDSGFLTGTWNGLYGSADGGQSWANLAPAQEQVAEAQSLLLTESGLLLGARSGLYRWQPERSAWELLPGGPPSGAMSLAKGEEPTLFAGTFSDGVYRSDDNSLNWQALPTLQKGVPALAVNPTNPNHILMLAIWERAYESHTGGQSWNARWEGLGDVVETTSLAVDPAEDFTYVGTEDGLFKASGNGPFKWTAFDLAGQSILTLLARPAPNYRSELLIGTTRGVFRSQNFGKSVQGSGDQRWGNGLENISVTALLVNPKASRQLYAGTAYAGVYVSNDNGYTWQPIGPPELNSGVVESLALGPEAELYVAATNGVWRGSP